MYLLTAPLRAAGRAGLSAVFVEAGYEAARNPGGRTAKAAKLGVPAPDLAVRVNGGLMVVFGATLGLGLRPRLSAAALAGLLIPTTLAGHPFWEESDPATRAQQRLHFLKNLAAFGGLLEVIGQPGRPHRRRDAAAGVAARAQSRAETAAARSRARAEEAAGVLWERAAAAVA